ncbi:WD40 repeat-like protein [Lophiostoma macrostomum CBS 122681]|uniref:WD40 repeat-like protein n=1 Tax=Lophiostoma macrostomum CBS 122681 TaxID=1314788 RepID=A0A6A6T7Q5_9PLEO|nr:WD40 repeat-like protein [Lophiostoma macrostomum CBS 122681]
MGKRKRGHQELAGTGRVTKTRKEQNVVPQPKQQKQHAKEPNTTTENEDDQGAANVERAWNENAVTIQIITGSYERVLHGFTASIPQDLLITGPDRQAEHAPAESNSKINFSDTFLFNAHGSAIRCLALSPHASNRNGHIMLATGSTDERINIHAISLRPVTLSAKAQLPTLHNNTITENRHNKLIGTLLQHSSSISSLYFPTRAKLITAAEDSTISIVRGRDWVPLETIKVPIPTPQGRPSGDTAGPGEVPSGINDFAVHPSMKLMLSVGKGEKCMRLWNLVTGKKAGVLTFSREVLTSVGEGRFGTGEGRKVIWDAEGDEFVVAFERGAIVYGIDCKPKYSILPTPRTKVHQIQYLRIPPDSNILAVSTEDGRIMFYNTSTPSPKLNTSQFTIAREEENPIPCALIAQLGGPAAGITGRVKDFEILPIPRNPRAYLITAGSSDGSVRLWLISGTNTHTHTDTQAGSDGAANDYAIAQVGQLLATHATNSRITCLKALVMTGEPEDADSVPQASVQAPRNGDKQPEDSSAEDGEGEEEWSGFD